MSQRADPVGSVVLDDRFCAGCGANLIDRPVEREPRYGLLVTRCATCGAVTAMEEHPTLARWLARWARMVAALWVLLLVGISAATIVAPSALTVLLIVECTDTPERVILDAYVTWANQHNPAETLWILRAIQPQFADFWAAQGERMLAELGRWPLEWDELPFVVFPAGIAFALGCFWSLALLHRRRLIAAAYPWFLLLPVMGLVAAAWWVTASDQVTSAQDVMWARWRYPMTLVALPLVGAALSAGIALGRSLARGAVRAFLPPRWRGPLAWLWPASKAPGMRGPSDRPREPDA